MLFAWPCRSTCRNCNRKNERRVSEVLHDETCLCVYVCIPDVYTQRGIGSPQMTTVWKYVRMDRPFALTKELAWMALLSKIPVDESWMTVVLMGLFLMVCTMILRFSSVLGNKIRNNENCSKKIVLESCIPLFFRRRLFFFNSINSL